MKLRKYEELIALKGKMREEKYTYRKLAEEIGMSLNTLNSRLNGYSVCDIDEVDKIVSVLNIEHVDVVKYFFPRLLRNATKLI